MFVDRLQEVAKAREVRVSFVSGDVHVGGVGRLYTRPKVHSMPCWMLASARTPGHTLQCSQPFPER